MVDATGCSLTLCADRRLLSLAEICRLLLVVPLNASGWVAVTSQEPVREAPVTVLECPFASGHLT